jgi:hypothetical protein
MSPLLVQSEATDIRHDRRLVRSLPSRSSSREGGKVVELNLCRPRATDDEGGDVDTDAGDPFGLSFKASLLRSMPPPLFGSLDDRSCEDLAGDRREPFGVSPITTCVTIFPNCPARSRRCAEACAAANRSVGRVRTSAEGIGNKPKRLHRQLFLGLFKIVDVYHGVGGGDAAARDASKLSCRPLPLVDTPKGICGVDLVALATNSSASSSRSRTEPHRPRLRRWTAAPTSIGGLITSDSSR